MPLLEIYTDGTKVYGPYVSSTMRGRKIVTLHRPDGSTTSTLYSRWLYQREYGVLEREVHIDHVNNNPLDDRIENLQPLSAAANIRKSITPAEVIVFTCPVCKTKARKLARHVRHNRKQGKAGPFCGKRCSRMFQITGV